MGRLRKNLLGRRSVCQKIKDERDPDAGPTNTGFTGAHIGVNGDALQKGIHLTSLLRLELLNCISKLGCKKLFTPSLYHERLLILPCNEPPENKPASREAATPTVPASSRGAPGSPHDYHEPLIFSREK